MDGCHALGVKVMLWYAVPFVGKNAKAAARFKDKTLRFDERLGTYVVDPRYPEVRQYLIDTYRAPSATGASTASSSTSSSGSSPTTRRCSRRRAGATSRR